MPTPSDYTPHLTVSAFPQETTAHTTCPPEIERGPAFTVAPEERIIDDDDAVDERTVSDAMATEFTAGRRPSDATSLMIDPITESSMKQIKAEEDVVMDSMSPASASSDGKEEQSSPPASQTSSAISPPSALSSVSYEFSNVRVSASAMICFYQFLIMVAPPQPHLLFPAIRKQV
jgi:hypothetical protein